MNRTINNYFENQFAVMYKIRLALLLLFGLTFLTSFGQKDSVTISDKYFQEGMEIFDFSHRKHATELFELATRMNPKSAKAQFMTGQSIMLSINKEQSLPYFLKAWKLDPNVDDEILFFIGKAYHYDMQLDSAIRFYHRYNRTLSRSLNFNKSVKINEVNRKIFECRNAMFYTTKPVNVKITPLGNNINSEYPDYAPTITEDETQLVFTTRRPDLNLNANVAVDHEYYEEIFFSQRINNEWQAASNIGPPLNTNFHNASVNLSPDGTKMILYQDANGGDLFISNRNAKGWSTPKPLLGINTEFLENSASVSKDDKHIFFTSNRPGGYGGTDIYSCELGKNGQWVNLKNLGPKVNTDMNEDGVYISSTGKHLYFSSNGLAGMGDLDIYRSTYDSLTSSWSDPINLGYPINSVENDIYFVLTADEKIGYLSSVREENLGEQDIYKIDMTNWKPVDLNQPEIIDMVESHNQPLKSLASATIVQPTIATITQSFKMQMIVIDQASGDPLKSTLVFKNGKGDPLNVVDIGTGLFEITLAGKRGSGSSYKLEASASGYSSFSSTLFVHGTPENSIQDTIRLERVMINLPYQLNIYFALNSDQPLSREGMQNLLVMLKNNSSMRVEISGHTDNQGAQDYNHELSQRRANAVKNYLVKSGADPIRITAVGYGNSKPVDTNLTKEGRRMNRRTEFKIIQQ
jgi:outer membrane protein OmpA-like peptidoglycan-associated protein/tetratricopeptide (TPR) repeat protein